MKDDVWSYQTTTWTGKKRLTDQVTEARALCEEELTDEILERLLKDLKKLLGRITKNFDTYKGLHLQLTQLAQTDKEKEKRLTEEGHEFGQLILDANEIISDLNVRIEEIEEKIERLKNPIPKAQTETKPSTLEIQLERLLQLEEKRLQKTEELESTSLQSQSFVKLPKLDFEKYNGDVLRFQEFWDNFSTSVHDNKRLRPVEKLNYLRAKVEGKAKAAIAGLEITNDNYDVAVKILRDRFGDPQTVISGHYTKSMDLPSSINQTTALRSTFDELEKHIRCLTALGEDTNHRQFVSLIMSKLPQKSSLN